MQTIRSGGLSQEYRKRAKRIRRVLIVDKHPVVRNGLACLIESQRDLIVCGQVGDVGAASETIAELKPHLVILDLSGRGLTGLGLIRTLVARHPRLPVLVLSVHDESLYAEPAIRAGACGYLSKQATTDRILAAIRQSLNGGTCRDRTSPLDRLSGRQREVLRLMGSGLTTSQMASALGISVSTVETHRANLKQRLGVANNAELLRRALCWMDEPKICG